MDDFGAMVLCDYVTDSDKLGCKPYLHFEILHDMLMKNFFGQVYCPHHARQMRDIWKTEIPLVDFI